MSAVRHLNKGYSDVHALTSSGARPLVVVVLCGLWNVAIPAQVNAQEFANQSHETQTGGSPPVAQFKASVNVNGIPVNTTSLYVKFRFMKKVAGGTVWVQMFQVEKTVSMPNANVTLDTSWQSMTPAPLAGDQVKVIIEGKYFKGLPLLEYPLTEVQTSPTTPVT